jgi:LacI family repressor for deo operon, udp, cdd, tsx, nupC, and nupG
LNKRPKIQDVAKIAGVSTATVSRTLSTPNLVSERTRDSVLRAVHETGYRVNRAARNLRTQRAGALLTLVPSLGNPFFSEILSGLERVSAAADYNILIADTSEKHTDADQLRRYFEGGQADGLIILDGQIGASDLAVLNDRAFSNNIVYACEWSEPLNIPSVRSDNAQGIYEAVKHLIDLGHRKIAHVTGPAGNVLSTTRCAAFEAAMLSRELPVLDDWIVPSDFSLEAGGVAARRILGLTEKPTAVICASDQIAFGLMAEMIGQGVHVPRDFSVVGFDDIEMAAYYMPPLTTVRQDRDRLGSAAAELIIDLLSGRPRDQIASVNMLPVELIVRKSTGAPREA